MNAFSPWLLNTNAALNKAGLEPLYEAAANGYGFKIYMLQDSCWLVVNWPAGSRLAFRLAYSPNDALKIKARKRDDGVTLAISSLLGHYDVVVQLPTKERLVWHYTTTLTPSSSLLFPYWPRDIVPLGAASSDLLAEGEVHGQPGGYALRAIIF